MHVTPREIQMALDKHPRLQFMLSDNPMATLLLDTLPEFLAAFPDWLSRKAGASEICELQIQLLLYCRDNHTLLSMTYGQSQKLSELFDQHYRQSPLAGMAVMVGSDTGMKKVLHGKIIRELDQKVVEFRNLTIEQEQALFRSREAHQRVIDLIGRGQLTFAKLLERSPHLMLVALYNTKS